MKHPYPQRIVDDVADYLKPYTSSRIEAGSLAHQLLNRIWKASRVDTLDQLTQLPDDAVIRGQDYWLGYTPDAQFQLDNDDLPAHVLHWGDTDE